MQTTINNNIYNNNIYNNNNNIISNILDIQAIGIQKCPNLQKKYLYCSNCDSGFLLELTCNSRSCEVCQKKRQKRLFMKYHPIFKKWGNISKKSLYHLTITNINVKDADQDYYVNRDKKFKLLLRKLKREGIIAEFGAYAKEMTIKDNGLHYHYHILMFSDYINLNETNISKYWEKISKDSKIVRLQLMENTEHGLNYILKYVTKTVENNTEMDKYFLMIKNRHYFQTFGKKYGINISKALKLRCSNCGSNFDLNKEDRRTPLLDELPNKYKKSILKLDYGRIDYFQSRKESVQVTIDFNKIEYDSIIEKIKDIIDKQNNAIVLEKRIGEDDLKYLYQTGMIFNIDPMNIRLVK